MKTGTAIWLIGWLFVSGFHLETTLHTNSAYKMTWQDSIVILFAWPAVLGELYAKHEAVTK